MSEAAGIELKAASPADHAKSFQPLNWWKAVLLVLGAAVCFHAAYTPAHPGPLALLIAGYVACVVQLARLRTTGQSFYTGMLTGMLCFGPQLGFFWRIFGLAAIALWAILALWLALFVALARVALVRLGPRRAVWLIPFLWMGLEYFRSELYYLKFSWLNAGYAFSDVHLGAIWLLGVYGLGFCIAAFASLGLILRFKCNNLLHVSVYVVGFAIVCAALFPASSFRGQPQPNPFIAGVQLEFPNASRILNTLNELIVAQTNAHSAWDCTNVDLIVLSEYTLDDPPSEQLKNWCRDNRKFLIVGGKEPALGTNFYNTAFVIGTNGEVIFKQAKSVPIQFFDDGLPAPEQKLWESPWGKIGICICYDLSYSRVTDELVRQGAQMLIVPTMDLAEWGRHQHELHARIAPVRAAEYGIPIFRLASSGISQCVDRSGNVRAFAPFPGEGEIIFFGINLDRKGSLPLDRHLAPVAVIVTAAFVLWLTFTSRKPRLKAPQAPP